jgi:hypothetical protein
VTVSAIRLSAGSSTIPVRSVCRLAVSGDLETIRVLYYDLMHLAILPGAWKHGIASADIRDAVDHALAVADLDGGPPRRFVVVGPDRAANLLEPVALDLVDGRTLVIHSMRLRVIYNHLLP